MWHKIPQRGDAMKPECKFYIVENGIETEISKFSEEECIRLDICAIKRLLNAQEVEVVEITPIFKNIL